MHDTELKTKVDEKTHDDFIVASRMHGFTCKSTFLRYLIERELYGSLSQLQTITVGSKVEGQKRG